MRQSKLFPSVPGSIYPDGLPGHAPSQDTSILAAEKISVRLNALQTKVLRYVAKYKELGVTVDEVVKGTGLFRNTAAPRMTELRAADLIMDSGKRHKSDSGSTVVIWQVTAGGISTLKEMEESCRDS